MVGHRLVPWLRMSGTIPPLTLASMADLFFLDVLIVEDGTETAVTGRLTLGDKTLPRNVCN